MMVVKENDVWSTCIIIPSLQTKFLNSAILTLFLPLPIS